ISEARSLMASLLVLSRTISAICTAWAWWTIMSRAKPASAESLSGGTEANSSASAMLAARVATTASSRSGLFCREGGRSLRDVCSISVFYSPNRGDRTPPHPCEPNCGDRRRTRISPALASRAGENVPHRRALGGDLAPSRAPAASFPALLAPLLVPHPVSLASRPLAVGPLAERPEGCSQRRQKGEQGSKGGHMIVPQQPCLGGLPPNPLHQLAVYLYPGGMLHGEHIPFSRRREP